MKHLLPTLWILLTMQRVSAQCPFLCECRGSKAECNGINSLNDLQLPQSIVQVKVNGGNFPVVAPYSFGNQTESIEFVACSIGEIQSQAFSHLQNLKYLHFRSSRIKRIMPCGFHSLSSVSNITFATSMIDDVKEGGFSNITDLEEISISLCHIKKIRPFAFQNIQVKFILLSDSTIDKIDTAGFSEISDVETFVMSRVTITFMATGAFHMIRNIKSVEIGDHSHFQALHHKTLMELREATLCKHGSFLFRDSYFNCDCSSAPMLEYIQANPSAVSSSVICSLTSKAVQKVTPEEVCPSYERQSYRTEVTLTLPTCTRTASNASSANAFQVLSVSPSKLRRNLANGRSDCSLSLLLLLLWCQFV